MYLAYYALYGYSKKYSILKILNGGFIMSRDNCRPGQGFNPAFNPGFNPGMGQGQCNRRQQHSHEICAGFESAGSPSHTHRCKATLFGVQSMPCGGHRHQVSLQSNFSGHNHRLTGECGPAIFVGGGKHVHFISGNTSSECGHSHRYQFCTSVDCEGM